MTFDKLEAETESRLGRIPVRFFRFSLEVMFPNLKILREEISLLTRDVVR